jgi:2-methylcitrate dehydratase PrpD
MAQAFMANEVPHAASSSKTIVQRLAAKVCAFDKSQLTKVSIAQAKVCILDTVGVTLAGLPEPCTQILLKTPGIAAAPGRSLIFGTHRRTSALDAALINGTASHALDFDDFSGALGGHHSVPLVSALFALAEERGATGEDILAAYVIGVETMIRVARAVNFHHYDKGWHPTSTLGTFGGAAAASHMMKLDPVRTARALSIAASLASGLKANFGTMTKPLHIGHCSRNGLFAALIAEGGFEAADDVFEHHQGFLDVFNGPGTYDVERMFENWGEPWEIEAPSIGLKQFPCCGSTHPAIIMALKLRNEESIRSADIAHVRVLPHVRRLRHTNTPHPQTPLEAKFSVQYAVARALNDGAVRLKDFEGEAHLEPEICRLLDVTEARPHPEMADGAEAQWGAEVIATLKDGRRLSRRVENLVGRGGDNPMDSSELWDKFSDCAGRALPREQIAPLFERLETLEKVAEMPQIMQLLEVGALHQSAPKTAVIAPRGEYEAPETTWVP